MVRLSQKFKTAATKMKTYFYTTKKHQRDVQTAQDSQGHLESNRDGRPEYGDMLFMIY